MKHIAKGIYYILFFCYTVILLYLIFVMGTIIYNGDKELHNSDILILLYMIFSFIVNIIIALVININILKKILWLILSLIIGLVVFLYSFFLGFGGASLGSS